MSSIDIEELDDENEARRDFRRSNGAPLVSDPENPGKWLRYSRPSSYAKCLDDEQALTAWRINKAMEGVARSPALQTQIVAARSDDRAERAELRNKALDRGTANEKADQGKGLHAMTVRAEDPTDVEFDPPEPYRTDLDAYTTTLASYGLVSEMFEIPMVNDTFHAAGTADRLWRLTRDLIAPDGDRIETGTLLIGDLKTGKKLDFSLPGFCVQTALYASSVFYDIHTERRMPTPPIDQRWTVLAHMPVGTGTCRLHWCSIKLGLIGAVLAHDVKDWRKKWKNGTYDAPLVDAPAELPVVSDVEPVSLAEMSEYCQRRINLIGANPPAKARLIQRWPEGLPTPKKGLKELTEVVTLLNLLDAIEAEFSIPFGEPDPRHRNQKGHSTTINRSNEYMLNEEPF